MRDIGDNTNATARRGRDRRRALDTRRASGSRMLALVRVMLASQAACTRKRKRIRRAPLDDAAVAILDAMTCAVVVAFSARHARARWSEVSSRRTPINGVPRARCSSRRLAPSVVPTREQGCSLRRELSSARDAFCRQKHTQRAQPYHCANGRHVLDKQKKIDERIA
jgi:hypothetical protein